MANNNRVEVHVGAKTSELKEGMQDLIYQRGVSEMRQCSLS
ncbi:hypothetical protein [Acinetobacter baumannii]|nr:hypothetical protein [Acinetobacter baumannii]